MSVRITSADDQKPLPKTRMENIKKHEENGWQTWSFQQVIFLTKSVRKVPRVQNSKKRGRCRGCRKVKKNGCFLVKPFCGPAPTQHFFSYCQLDCFSGILLIGDIHSVRPQTQSHEHRQFFKDPGQHPTRSHTGRPGLKRARERKQNKGENVTGRKKERKRDNAT